MKLASLDNGTRDGSLVIVTSDLTRCVGVSAIAPTLQQALDNWDEVTPELARHAALLERDEDMGGPFEQSRCRSPLPRAFQWADGSAFVNHVELVRKARGAQMPESFWAEPLMYQGGSDSFLDPHGEIVLAHEAWGMDFEAEIAVVTNDVPMGVSREAALDHVVLIMLANDVSLRNLIPGELAKGFGFFQSKPSTAFSPIAVTPDELGTAWADGKLHLPLLSDLNGKAFGKPDAGVDMTFDFGDLICHAARSRPLCAGSIIGSGTVSNKGPEGSPGKSVTDGGAGYSCIAELRMVETIRDGSAHTPFMSFGDVVDIRMMTEAGSSIFGSITQKVVRHHG
ncbi:fumarylacetoacetate hydrolase family protein [Anderseniella sp. Alg231-50]|uniref:fumarylacetoacetate hydrolase family protein n=1 Tax=Anderseniella sp. Alg231-50 TaxID=1922226 RepID=UPI000D5528D6